MSEIIELINYLNSSGGIPLSITTTTITNWKQYGLTIAVTLLSSVFILIYLWNGYIKQIFSDIIIRLKLKRLFKNKNVMIIKHTSSGLFGGSMISQETVRDVIKGMNKFKGKPFDLVLYTPGGDIFSSMFISRLIKNYPSKVRAIIPIYAMSGGSLLALSCDEILMGRNACIGCIDPQLGNLFKFGSAKAWEEIVKRKGNKAEDSSISFAMIGKQYTKSIKDHLVKIIGNKMKKKEKIDLVNFLTAGDVEHAYAIMREELHRKGLKVETMNLKMEEQLNKILSSELYEGVYYK